MEKLKQELGSYIPYYVVCILAFYILPLIFSFPQAWDRWIVWVVNYLILLPLTSFVVSIVYAVRHGFKLLFPIGVGCLSCAGGRFESMGVALLIVMIVIGVISLIACGIGCLFYKEDTSEVPAGAVTKTSDSAAKAIFSSALGVALLLIIPRVFGYLASILFVRYPGVDRDLIVIQRVLPFVFVLCAAKILKKPLRAFRICKPEKIPNWMIGVTVVPIAIIGLCVLSGMESDYAYFIFIQTIPLQFFLIISEEWILRGYVMSRVEEYWNPYAAVIAPSVGIGLVRALLAMQGESILNAVLMFVITTGVGIILSLITRKSGSVWTAVAVHFAWSVCAIVLMTSLMFEFGSIGNLLLFGTQPITSRYGF